MLVKETEEQVERVGDNDFVLNRVFVNEADWQLERVRVFETVKVTELVNERELVSVPDLVRDTVFV